MRILIVNTSENVGGAAVAANRLMEALNNNGVKAKMLVMKKTTDHITVVGLPHAWLQRLHFLWERFVIYCHLHFSRHNLFAIDIANAGTDITSLREFKEADLIHLSWINQGMLSLADIKRIVRSGKPVVWTMHDLWTATGICHYVTTAACCLAVVEKKTSRARCGTAKRRCITMPTFILLPAADGSKGKPDRAR